MWAGHTFTRYFLAFCLLEEIYYVVISYSMNLRKDVDVVYFDFAKAFDSVNHDIILQKLKYMFNINGLMLNFVRAYLKGRTQRVVVGMPTRIRCQ